MDRITHWPRRAALFAALLAAGLAGCADRAQDAVPSATSATAGADRSASTSDEGNTSPSAPAARADVHEVAEAFRTVMTPEDNIDSVASWTAPDGSLWLVATAKATDRLVVYDGATGATLRHVGSTGDAPGEFRRPNGIAIAGDLVFVVERDGRRVQVMRLPDFSPLGVFGSEQLVKPYGLWIHASDEGGYQLYVTDAYMAGEDTQGEDILPPLDQLDRRVHRFDVRVDGDAATGTPVGHFGDTTPEGALRVVESLWGDPANDRLLVAEEDETYANEIKVYHLDGRYAGQVIGGGVFQAQAEGIMLRTCADGGGWWITTEQGKAGTVFHLFDRVSLQHAGAVAGPTVANTDGIWLHQAPTAAFPDGVLYAVHDDQGAVAIDWREITQALSLPACPNP